MMQSCASAAKLRAAGPFSLSASVPCLRSVPATSENYGIKRAELVARRRGNFGSDGRARRGRPHSCLLFLPFYQSWHCTLVPKRFSSKASSELSLPSLVLAEKIYCH